MKERRSEITMDLRQLRIFNTVAITENMSKSSDILNLSQSSISKAVASLEEEVGCPLFFRNGKKLYLNEEGKDFLEYSTRVLELLDEGINNVNNIKDENLNRINVGLVGDCSQMISCITDFLAEHPEVSFNIDSDIAYDKEIDMKKYDMLVCPDNSKYLIYTGVKSYSERYYLCVNSGHPLADKLLLSTGNLDGLNYVFIKHGSTVTSVRRSLKALGITVGKEFCVSDHFIQRMLISAGLAAGFVTDGALKYYENCSDIRIIPIADKRFSIDMKICFKADRHLSDAALAFRDYVVNNS